MNITTPLKVLAALMLGLVVCAVIFAAFSHRILPADADECQRDVTHLNHVAELPMFHCIGHTEYNYEKDEWDHVHPWMTPEWHREHGIDESDPR